MGIFDWSATASGNASVGLINWAENQLPNSVNDSSRAEMADVAAWRNLIGGAKSTGGSSGSYTLTTGTGVSLLAAGVMVAFKANHTNTGAATLNVDGLGGKAIRKGGDFALAADDIKAGGHYLAQYDPAAASGAGAWMLLNPTTSGGSATSAADVAFDGTDSGLAATDVQEAIDELAGDVLAAPAGDRLLGYDSSANTSTWFELGSGLSITGTTVTVDFSGVIGTSTSASGTDLDTITAEGAVRVMTPVNAPADADVWVYVETILHPDYAYQWLANLTGTDRTWERWKRAGVWGVWREVWSSFSFAPSDFATAAQGAKADSAVQSDPTGVTGADAITNMMSLTQAEFDAIGTPDATTYYVITDAA